MVALFSLRCCVKRVENFWIAMNVAECGNFDDVVLFKKEQNKEGTTYLIQLKHQTRATNIREREFFKFRGDFFLKRYLDTCLFLSEAISTRSLGKSDIIDHLIQNPNVVYVIYTNKDVDSRFEFLEPTESELINVKGRAYKFKFEHLPPDIYSNLSHSGKCIF